MQKLINGNWIEFAGEIVNGVLISEDIIVGDIYRNAIGGNPVNGWEQKTYTTPTPEPDPFKMVGMADLGELLPDAVIVELEDMRNTKTVLAGKRQAAARILARIYSNIKVDVMNGKFTELLTNLVTHTTLTAAQATVISNTLKG